MATVAAAPIDAAPGATSDQPKTKLRVECLDLIRGLAVMGIVLSNLDGFAGYPLEHQWPSVMGPMSPASEAAWMFNYLFVDGKLRGLFSLLFGAGMVIFLDRAKARGANAVWLQVRRLFWLMVFGLLHFYLLFDGDILHNYALAGLVALLFVRLPAKWLLGGALGVLLAYSYFPTTGLWGFVTFERAAMADPSGGAGRDYASMLREERADNAEEGKMLATGSLPEIVADKFERYPPPSLFEHAERWLFEYLCLMLAGAALYRLGFFSGEWDRKKMLGWGLAGIAASAIASFWLGWWAVGAGHPRGLNMFVYYGPVYPLRLPMILGFAAVLVALSGSILKSGIGRRCAAAGRMAFSNYIGSSLVAALLFQGFGLGLLGQYDRAERFVFALGFWLLILLWSKPWLERFRFGPMEWLWRCLTYWQLFPFRKREAT